MIQLLISECVHDLFVFDILPRIMVSQNCVWKCFACKLLVYIVFTYHSFGYSSVLTLFKEHCVDTLENYHNYNVFYEGLG